MDGARVRVIYPGNTRTCARCHSPPNQCPGNGIARQCEAEGTDRVSLSLHLKQLGEKLSNINKGGANGGAAREKEEGRHGNPAGTGTPSDAGTLKVPTAALGAGTLKVTTPPPDAVNHESDGDGGNIGAGTTEVTTSPPVAGTREVTAPPPGGEYDGDGGKPTPGTPTGADISGATSPPGAGTIEVTTPDAAPSEVTLSPPGAGTKEVTTPAQEVQALGDELAAAALDAAGSWADESQSSFEKSKFRSPGGTIPTEHPENNESLKIFREVIDKVLTQDTPKKNAFEMLMSSTPIQRPTSGIPKPSRSKSVKREPNRTPEGESNSRRRLQSDA